MFFNFWALLFKMYVFKAVTLFSRPLVIPNQLNVSVAVHVYKIHVFDKAFFLLIIRMPMMTKPVRVVTCCEELSPINMHDISEWSCGVT